VPRVGGDVAEHVLHFFAEAKPDRHGVDLIDRFGRVGNFFEDDFAKREREIDNVPIVGFQKCDELRIGRTSHSRKIIYRGLRLARNGVLSHHRTAANLRLNLSFREIERPLKTPALAVQSCLWPPLKKVPGSK